MADSILYNEDCIRAMKRLASDSIDLILTDPYERQDTNLKKMRDNFFAAAGWDNLSFEEWEKSMDNFFEEAVRVLKKGGAMLVFMSDESIAEAYKLNHPNTKMIVADIKSLPIENTFAEYRDKIDVIIGGPPCQGFSQKG